MIQFKTNHFNLIKKVTAIFAISLSMIVGTSLIGSSSAFAWSPLSLAQSNIGLRNDSSFNATGPDDKNNVYQIGDEWGKKQVSEADLQNPVFHRAAYATARVGSATGFYLGHFAGAHLVATNNHVCPSQSSCVGKNVSFQLLNETFRVKDMIGTWPEIDLALLVIQGSSEDQESKLTPYAGSFAFGADLIEGTPLLTIGYGIANNSRRNLVANLDADCVVFSKKNDFHFIDDPDQLNPGSHKTWSFANGCDVSHGDSGSAMVNRLTGEVVGIIWTGKIPKNTRVQSSKYIQSIIGSDNPDVWSELSFGVPAAKIRDHLLELSKKGAFVGPKASMVEAFLSYR